MIALAAAVMPSPAAAATRAQQMVVFRDGSARVTKPSLAATRVTVGGKRCAVGSATPLAVLLNSRIGPLSLRDFGACSKRAADAGGLFVARIGPDRNRGSDGWVYKVGNVLATAGAADPSGPFGRGRLRAGARVTWLWCHVSTRDRGCPHTLVVSASATPGRLSVRVRRYDDRGKGVAAPGATVHAGGQTAAAGADGVARFALPAGSYKVHAEQPTRIRSFPVAVTVP